MSGFLAAPALSVGSLVAQVQGDNLAMTRYMRQFSMTQDQVISYLGSLHVDHLSRAGFYMVYGVRSDGASRGHLQAVAQGETVFADGLGTPIILAENGDPMTLGPNADRSGLGHALNAKNDVVGGGAAVDTSASGPMALTSPEDAVDSEAAAQPLTQGGAVVGDVASGSTATGTVLAVGGAVVLGLGASNDGHTGPAPVPEPMTMVALGTGIAAVIARRRRS